MRPIRLEAAHVRAGWVCPCVVAMAGLSPYAYLRHVFERIPAAQVLEDFEAILP